MKMKGLAFECSSGRVVKVHEAICWRHAEGRSCFPPHDGTRLPDVVVVPVAPNVHEREEGGKAGAEAPAGLDAAAAAAYNRYGGRIWGALERARTARPAPQVKDAAEQAMMDACGNVGNRDIEPFVPTLVGCILNLGNFFENLCLCAIGIGPVKTSPRGPLLDFFGTQQGGEAKGDTGERARIVIAFAFQRLDAFPIGLLRISKDVRVTSQHLFGNGVGHIVKAEMACFVCHLRMEHDLKQQVTQFILQGRQIIALNRVSNLIGLFNGVGGNGRKTLFYIPRAAILGVPQLRHDREKLVNGSWT
jgi:hypothetical protein